MSELNYGSVMETAVTRLIGDWVSLQIAIEHGMGGEDAKLKETWMIRVIGDFLCKNPSCDPTELEDYLAEIIFNEFDTVIEDGTLPHMAVLIFKMHSMCMKGDFQAVLSSLPKERPKMPPVSAEPEPMAGEEEVTEEDMEQCATQMNSSMSLQNGDDRARQRIPALSEPDEDGWVTVNRTKK